MDDATLIHRLFSHDRRALSAFYREYAPQLRRFIASKIHSPEDVEEILQDTLFSFLEGLRDFRKESSIRTFLFSICQHKIIDHYRKKKLKHLVFSQMPQLESLVSPLLGPEEALDITQIKEKISTVFSRMLPMYRHVLILKYLEHASVGEIAENIDNGV